MATTVTLRLGGLCCAVGGAALVALMLVESAAPGGCVDGACPTVSTRVATSADLVLAVVTAVLLPTAGTGFVAGSRYWAPVRGVGVAAAGCAAGAALFGSAAAVTAARTRGETWLMPVFVFPTLLSVTATAVLLGVVVLRARLVPRRMATTLIVAACLLPLYTRQLSPGDLAVAPFGVMCMVTGVTVLLRAGRIASPEAAPP